MVSHTALPDRVLTERAPSNASRSVASRRHRSSRSHTGAGGGGTSRRLQNEFPNFAQTGDVHIVITAAGQEKRYTLHRLILSQCSGFFEAGTSEEWTSAQAQLSGSISANGQGRMLDDIHEDSQSMRGGGDVSFSNGSSHRCRWRYELDWGGNDDDTPMLVQRQPQTTLFGGDAYSAPPPVPNKPGPLSHNSGSLLKSISNFGAMQSASHISQANHQAAGPGDSDVIRDYDNLFRIFYNHAPNLDAHNIAEAYVQCKSLLNVADMYDALEVVGPRIDHHLLQFQSRLWKQIRKYGPSYLKLGWLARSKVIFAEALVHVVGQWPSGSSQLKHTVPTIVQELIEDKVDELAERRTKAEMRLFRLSLLTTRGERITPANGYIDWLAMSLFRQWLAENTSTPAPISKAPADASGLTKPVDSGTLYRILGTGGSAYLNHDECKRFIRLRPDDHSRETLKKFERRLDDIKAQAKEIVRPLMKSYLELDMSRDGAGISYLTCTKVDDDDFPWEE